MELRSASDFDGAFWYFRLSFILLLLALQSYRFLLTGWDPVPCVAHGSTFTEIDKILSTLFGNVFLFLFISLVQMLGRLYYY